MGKDIKGSKLVDYIFWISFIFFSNPGGILKALGEKSGDGGVNVADVLFLVMSLCFLYIFQFDKKFIDKTYNQITKSLILFLVYYIVVFSFFIPLLKNNPYYNFVTTYIKIRSFIMGVALVFYVYEFYLRNSIIFFKMLLFSSIGVLSIFLVSLIIGVDILPINRVDRRFIDTNRLALTHYGIMHILIPMGVTILVFKFNIKFKKYFIIGFILMFMAWVLAITRRYIFGTFIYAFIALLLYNFINKKTLIHIKSVMNLVFFSIFMAFLIQFTFPKYAEAGVAAYDETIYVIKYGESTTGKTDSRLGFGKAFIQNIIKENYIFGTGFDNRWRSKMDENSAQYEATDYPFLASIAMTGIVGILLFIPLYFYLVKALIFDIKYFRKHSFNHESFQAYVIMFSIIYFIFDLMKYMDWFIPIASTSDIRFWTFYAIYFASRNLFYREEKFKDKKSIITRK